MTEGKGPDTSIQGEFLVMAPPLHTYGAEKFSKFSLRDTKFKGLHLGVVEFNKKGFLLVTSCYK